MESYLNRMILLKKITIAGLLVMSTLVVSSQNNKLFLEVSGGPSFPFGKYADTKLGEGSFTITGYYISAAGVWYIFPRIGVGLEAAVQQHPVDVGSLGYAEVQADPFLEDIFIRSEAYLMITGMGGIYYRERLSEKFSLTGNIRGGILYGRTPWQLYKQQFVLEELKYGEITSAKDWKPTVAAGIDVRYDISPCFGLVFNSSITYGELSFGFISGSGTRIENRSVMYLNTGLGLQFDL